MPVFNVRVRLMLQQSESNKVMALKLTSYSL